MPKIHNNTCPAFFLDATIDPAGSYSPCTALGGGVFNFGEQTFKLTWQDPKLADARSRSIAGEKLDMCRRCWSEEELGHTSERQCLLQDVPEGIDYTDPGYYLSGPRHINIKVSNICNLRCRTCQSKDSYLYHIEGEYYEKKNNLTRTAYTIDKFKKHFTDVQLDELFEFSTNLERIELYGGEPFLDDQVPKYLLRLVEAGLAKNIDLSVSTNATHKLTDTWRTILTNFKNVIINVSIDGIDNKFTYMRHPGKWTDAQDNINDFFKLKNPNNNINVVPVVTVSALNVWNVHDVFEYFTAYNVEPFIILVQWPQYYCVNVLPNSIKPIVEAHLRSFKNPKLDAIINLMYTEPKTYRKDSALTPWEEFKFWTREKDAYRNESFTDTFDVLGEILIEHKEW
jgi:MoaA/NifB/PqqE/SkfB family radical SAM enzyme